MFTFTVDPYKKLELLERLQNFADGMEKATMDRAQEVLETGRARTIREIELSNASRLSTFYRAIGIDPASMDRTAETVTGSLYIDDTFTVPLEAFRAYQTEIGVVVQFDRYATATAYYPGAFGPEIPKLGNKIYRRITRKRLPIEKIADLKATEIPGLKENLERVAPEMRADFVRKVEKDKAALVKEWRRWHRQ